MGRALRPRGSLRRRANSIASRTSSRSFQVVSLEKPRPSAILTAAGRLSLTGTALEGRLTSKR
jgi:hypothetical protein